MEKPAGVIFCMQASVASTSLKAYHDQVLEYSLSVLRNIVSKCMVADDQWRIYSYICARQNEN